ncbi:hypothetical protein KQX54_013418 [Cotesia glomerata]|uniref:Uncharacterized protein n=1 Tax=Cotesia glomerata TaxID=32391 RepID=A0AAV7HTX1_COTGL|nr:hypothetical protein KQX54_013418 [Cotesia glomerata]
MRECSTPLNSNQFSLLEIRLSAIQPLDLTQVVLDNTDSSGVPSLPSGLSEAIGESWLIDSEGSAFNESQINIGLSDFIDHGEIVESQEDSLDGVSSSLTQECIADNNSLNADVSTQETSSSITSHDMLNVDDNLSNVMSDHSYSSAVNSDLSSPCLNLTENVNLKILRTNRTSKRTKKQEKEIVSKQYFCPYCKSMVTKFARHSETSHKDVDKVKRFLKFPLRSTKRNLAIASIKNEGTYLHNTSKEFNTRTLLTSRRAQPGYNRSVKDYNSCEYYDKNTLGEICKNLNCQSPKIKLCDTQKRNKPKVVSVKSVRTRTTILTQPEKGKDKDTTFDGSGFSYEETESGKHENSLSLTDSSASSDSSSEDYFFNVPGNSACDDSDLKSTLPHDAQNEVKKFIFLPPKSQEREAIAEIRKKGDFKLFTNAKLNNGIIVPSRRPASAEKAKAENFTAYIKCKGIYTKNNLRHHFAQCNNNQPVPSVLKKARITVGQIYERVSTVLRQELIRANLRLCGRFLLHIKQLNPQINDFSSIYNPTMYHFLIGAIDSFAGVNNTTGHYEKANNAREMSKHIKKIGEIYIGECIINENPQKQKEIQDFLNLCKRGFANVTNKTAMETLVARQREKTILIPSTLMKKFSDATLTRIQVFNRRRAGEAERLLISDLKNVQKITEKDEGVSKKNLFVFGIDGKENDSFLFATALMRRFSDECNAENPKSLRGTPLRKHVATKCTQFGLNKTKITHVAKFMGHDIKINENIYKQPVAKTDIIDMSKVLEKAQHVYDDSSENDVSVNSNPNLSESGASQDVSPFTDKDNNTDSADNSIADSEISNSLNVRLNKKKSLKIQKVRWTTSEFKLLNQYFGVYIKSETPPSFPDIRSIQRSKNMLLNRTPIIIRAEINNTIKAGNKKNSKDDNNRAKITNKSQIKSHIKFFFGKYYNEYFELVRYRGRNPK